MQQERLYPKQETAPSLPIGDVAESGFPLPLLPYPQDALEPYMSALTLSFHYGKHHRAYVDNLNKMAAGTLYATLPLDELIRRTAEMPDKAALFNNAAQAWNHTFFWHSMRPGGGGQPATRLMDMITKAFGSFESFKHAFVIAAVGQFGSGGVWLVQDNDHVRIVKRPNAQTPIAYGQNALLTCDVWEHAYYLDYQNRRNDFVQNFLDHLANWEFATAQMTCPA
ncbi:MAG: superoxide dismutase [bacterium]